MSDHSCRHHSLLACIRLRRAHGLAHEQQRSSLQVQAYLLLGTLQKAFEVAAAGVKPGQRTQPGSMNRDVGIVAAEARRCGDVAVAAACEEWLKQPSGPV